MTDQLGTANTTVELGGTQTVTRRAFKPYGEARGPKPSTWPNKRSYLGVGIDDATTGLTHLGAREYDQAAGRFLSADPIIDMLDPLQMNGYAYSNNSPISNSDPSGLCPKDVCDGYGQYTGAVADAVAAQGGGGGGHANPSPPTSGTPTTVTYTITKTVTVTKPATCNWLCQAKGWMRKHADIITIVTEVVVGVSCGVAAVAAGAATAGVGAVAVGAACGTIAGAAAGLVGNALAPEADHSLGGYASAIGKGAAVGAVSSIIGGGVAKGAAKVISKVAPGVKAAVSKVLGKGGGAGATTPKCFLAGTLILLANGNSKKIEDIKVGDKVLATNPTTGETSAQSVTELLPSEGDKELNELTIATADGKKKITATAEHPFWVPKENAWVNAADLKPGTTLSTPHGTKAKITANRPYKDHVRTYNFSVAKLHTYVRSHTRWQ
ncbi:polymorphic toxin-type HINT domain-containing protein [Streptomyces sp. NPDC058391]|uniref:polymorphic toxin-type HINT domain-containing protein n=1 Tax=Streptomyces sp. NPDC058391 TaxID=3346476 RepID=UPI00364B1A80